MTSGPNIPREQRKRPTLEITLSPEAHGTLERMASECECSRSEVLEALVQSARGCEAVQRWRRANPRTKK